MIVQSSASLLTCLSSNSCCFCCFGFFRLPQIVPRIRQSSDTAIIRKRTEKSIAVEAFVLAARAGFMQITMRNPNIC